MTFNAVYHGNYKPTSRFVLLSNDHQMFSVSKAFLARNSVFFRDMLQLPRPMRGGASRRCAEAAATSHPEDHSSPAVPSPPLVVFEGLGEVEAKTSTMKQRGSDDDEDWRCLDLSEGSQPLEIADDMVGTTSGGKQVADTGEIIVSNGNGISAEAKDRSPAGEKSAYGGVEERKNRGEDIASVEPVTVALQHGSTTSNKPSEPTTLEIDANWSTLALFLDLLQVAQFTNRLIPVASLDLTLNQIRSIFPLVQKFDCERAGDMLRARLEKLAPKNPWGVFELASDLQDVDLAKLAIMHLGPWFGRWWEDVAAQHQYHRHDVPRSKLWSQLANIRPDWHLPFLEAIGSVEAKHDYGPYAGDEFEEEPPVHNYLAVKIACDFALASMHFHPPNC